ncbi:pyruvate kinase [Flammeovirgaceae bacterium 311]|nr:pyruvate kinase [Flammeovirgaceae bacterium 311]
MQKSDLHGLLQKIEEVLSKAQVLENNYADATSKVHPAFNRSVRNLLHYLALRNTDIRSIQEQLSTLGLSSLGRSESHVLPSLHVLRLQLQQMLECTKPDTILELSASFGALSALLKTHSEALLGKQQAGQGASIMVTMDAEMARDVPHVKELLQAGMNCARINCAHDDADAWSSLAKTIRQALAETGISCPIFMDLAGPKLRTGPMTEKPKLLQIKPKLNTKGQITESAMVWLVPEGVKPPEKGDATLPVDAAWLKALKHGQKIKFKDVRGRSRQLRVQQRKDNCVLTYLYKNAYISTGTLLQTRSSKSKEKSSTEVGLLPKEELVLRLNRGDTLVLHSDDRPGEPAKTDEAGNVTEPAHIACTLPEILADVEAGDRVLFNDGKIEGKVTTASKEQLTIQITFARDKGSKLRGNKSINFPDSNLSLHGLTDKDRQDLAEVVKLADVVNVSFVQTPEDIEELFAALKCLKAPPIGVLLKIETKRAFNNLPLLLLTLMQHYPAGIMIARGDLAVEVGWNRLAEVQEEMLWLCEAAHLPVVWATQVLETLAKKGRPSRAEITDAAMSQRAECVMLNKGPHIVEAIRTLRDIMQRMQGHQSKKTSMLRSLTLAEMK